MVKILFVSFNRDFSFFEARNMTLFRELADQEDGRLISQNKHLIRVWMPGSFIDQRERSNEELKSKGRTKKEMQWGREV